jgi:ethanolaminephosphotransferase
LFSVLIMTYLTISERENLLKYKYKGGDQSYLYSYVLSPWAQFCVDLTPTWVAPNLITFVGLCLPITSLILTLLYNPTLEAETQPAWLSIFTGCGIFIYQTLDNMDGKQARKTGSSSPLGMLFDHGCDAMNAVISPITVSAVYGTGWTTKLFLTYGCATIPFFLQTWEEFYIGEMFLPVINGPSEGLIMTVATCFATAHLGSAWWHVVRTNPVVIVVFCIVAHTLCSCCSLPLRSLVCPTRCMQFT